MSLAPLRRLPLHRNLILRPTLTPFLTTSIHTPIHSNKFSTRNPSSMSYSNADTGSKTADPFVAKNTDSDASAETKVKSLLSFVDQQKFCMMTTNIAGEHGFLASRCMALAGKEGNGVDLIFHANSESGKTDDLQKDPKINLAFLASSGEWASISGTASIVSDRETVRKHYSSHLKAWMGDLGDGKHDGGPDDPRIVVSKVKAQTVQYAISQSNMVGQAYQVAKGVVTGEAAHVNKLRHLSESELEQCRRVAFDARL